MKLLTFILACILVLTVEVAKGQLFVGGNIGLNYSGGSIDNSNGVTVDKVHTTTFSFNPMVGYFLSENFAVGGALGLTSIRTVTPGNPETIDKTFTFGISPFVRYYVLRVNKFAIFGTGYIGLAWGSEKSTTGPNTTTGPSTTTFQFGITPNVSFDVTDKISLEAGINLLDFNYRYDVTKTTAGNGAVTKNNTSTFNFGAGLNNIFTTGAITVGAIFKL